MSTVNYVDRQVLGLLSKDLKDSIGWTEIDYGNIVAAFNAAYAFGLLLAGRLMDRIGTRAGYALAIVWWSLAAMAHALARTPLGFGVARAALGAGEAGNFPAAIKTVAEWFPKKERAFATGVFNAGSNVGAIVAPLTCRGSPRISAGVGRSYSRARSVSCGSCSGYPFTGVPSSIRMFQKLSWTTFKAIHRIRRRCECRG